MLFANKHTRQKQTPPTTIDVDIETMKRDLSEVKQALSTNLKGAYYDKRYKSQIKPYIETKHAHAFRLSHEPTNANVDVNDDKMLEQAFLKSHRQTKPKQNPVLNNRPQNYNLDDTFSLKFKTSTADEFAVDIETFSKYPTTFDSSNIEDEYLSDIDDDTEEEEEDEADDDENSINLNVTVVQDQAIDDDKLTIDDDKLMIVDKEPPGFKHQPVNANFEQIIRSGNQIDDEPYVLKEIHEPIIPTVCYTTWHTKDLPPNMDENYTTLKEQNPEMTFELFDEQDCRNFITHLFDKDVVDAYDSLAPSSYKSDLWRYCILYTNGGIYMDIKYGTVNGFRLYDLCDKEYFVLDHKHFWEENQHGIYTALIVSQPRNKILRQCINEITQNTEKQFYGRNALYPTGPGLLGKVYFNGNINDNFHLLHDIDLFHHETTNGILYKNKQILDVYPGYREEQSLYQNNLHYSNLWKQNAIYNKKYKQLVRKKNIDQKQNEGLSKVLCIVHIGNYHIFTKMKKYIDNLIAAQHDEYTVDIFFNVIETVTKEQIHQIKKAYKNENIIYSENYGFDIGSFFHILEIVKKQGTEYNFILKLHTKTDNTKRDHLLQPILGSIENIRKIIRDFDSRPNLGMIASKSGRCIDAHADFIRNQPYMQQLMLWFFNESTLIVKQPYVSGTMFWMRFSVINDLFMKIHIPNIYNSLNNVHSFDWNWYYHANNKLIGNQTLNHEKLYEHYINIGRSRRLSGNIFHAIKYDTQSVVLRDGMQEHAYERFFSYGVHRLGLQTLFITE